MLWEYQTHGRGLTRVGDDSTWISLCGNISWRGMCDPGGAYRHQSNTNINQLPYLWISSSRSSGLKTKKETVLFLNHSVISNNTLPPILKFQNPGTRSSRRVSTPIKTRFLRKKENHFLIVLLPRWLRRGNSLSYLLGRRYNVCSSLFTSCSLMASHLSLQLPKPLNNS